MPYKRTLQVKSLHGGERREAARGVRDEESAAGRCAGGRNAGSQERASALAFASAFFHAGCLALVFPHSWVRWCRRTLTLARSG